MYIHSGCIKGQQDYSCKYNSYSYVVVRPYTQFLNNDSECKKLYFQRRAGAEGKISQELNIGKQLFIQEKCLDLIQDYLGIFDLRELTSYQTESPEKPRPENEELVLYRCHLPARILDIDRRPTTSIAHTRKQNGLPLLWQADQPISSKRRRI